MAKIVLGVFCLSFFLNYQPSFKFPPFKENKTFAQVKQTQQIDAQAMPFVFQIPHPGYMSTPFSSYHPAIDLATGLGMPIKPIAPGTIVEAGYNFWGLGLMVTVDHGQGYSSTYGHMGKIYVTKGQVITDKDFIGEVGLTGHTSGPHTHLEVKLNNSSIDPLAILPQVRVQPEATDFIPVTAVKQTPIPKLDLKTEIKKSL